MSKGVLRIQLYGPVTGGHNLLHQILQGPPPANVAVGLTIGKGHDGIHNLFRPQQQRPMFDGQDDGKQPHQHHRPEQPHRDP